MAGVGTPTGLQCRRELPVHAESILALLNATRCERCGRAAVPGVTMCLPCAVARSDDWSTSVVDAARIEANLAQPEGIGARQ